LVRQTLEEWFRRHTVQEILEGTVLADYRGAKEAQV
jgi:hypothetical protein